MKKSLALLRHLFVLSLILVVVEPRAAHAYIDPNTGSTIIQAVIAGLATGAYLLKVFWGQITGFFGKLFKRGAEDK